MKYLIGLLVLGGCSFMRLPVPQTTVIQVTTLEWADNGTRRMLPVDCTVLYRVAGGMTTQAVRIDNGTVTVEGDVVEIVGVEE